MPCRHVLKNDSKLVGLCYNTIRDLSSSRVRKIYYHTRRKIRFPDQSRNRKQRCRRAQKNKMSLILSPVSVPLCRWGNAVQGKQLSSRLISKLGGFKARACLSNRIEEPILKEALKEPVAFMGGIFAGLLRLDLNEDPLKEWVARTVEASGITEEESIGSDAQEETPQQIEIE